MNTLIHIVNTLETNTVFLCFDKIFKLEGNHYDHEKFSSEGSHKGKDIEDYGYNNENSFFECSHNMIPRFHKFDRLDWTS